MSDILGFAVLSGPLWLIVLWLPVSIWLGVRLSKRFKPTGPRLAAGFGIFLLAYFLPFADEIIGRMYFNYLCTHEAGVKVYQTVELPGEYWDEQGRPKFYNEMNGNFTLSRAYPTKLNIQQAYPLLAIDKLVGVLREQGDGKLISENVSYRYWGGWIRRNFSPSNTAKSCGNYLEQYSSFIRQVFKPADTK